MKKLIFAVCAAASVAVFADAADKTVNPARPNRAIEVKEKIDAKAEAKKASEAKMAEAKTEEEKAEAAKDAEALEEVDDLPIFWGFANYGIYSGYLLYGSLVNPDPVLQGYVEANFNLPWSVGPLDNLGYFGGGVWSNTDLTRRRNDLRGAFNEWDFNIHWGKVFWIDDDRTWGLETRTWVVWYYYPPRGGDHPNTKTTFDWDYTFALLNPYVIPFIDVIHEYTGHGTVLQFGLRRPFFFFDNSLTIMPALTFVARNSHYGWCFPNYGKFPEDGNDIPAGLATMKISLDATYMFNQWIGVFVKCAVCVTTQDDLRDACTHRWPDSYGYAKDFFWAGAGVCANF